MFLDGEKWPDRCFGRFPLGDGQPGWHAGGRDTGCTGKRFVLPGGDVGAQFPPGTRIGSVLKYGHWIMVILSTGSRGARTGAEEAKRAEKENRYEAPVSQSNGWDDH